MYNANIDFSIIYVDKGIFSIMKGLWYQKWCIKTICGLRNDTNSATHFSMLKNFQDIMKISTFFVVLVAQTLGKRTQTVSFIE